MPEAPIARGTPRGSGETVVVACKLPNGFVMREFEWEKTTEPKFGGGYVDVRLSRPTGRTATLNGAAMDIRLLKKQITPAYPIVYGYGLTVVPRDLWEHWLLENADSAMVKNGLVFAHDTEIGARAQAKDGAKIESGLEPIDPSNPGAKVAGIQKYNANDGGR